MAIKGFEEFTNELYDYEKESLLPMLTAKLVLHKGRAQAITNAQLRNYIFDRTGKNTREPRIRKIAEYIRQTHLLENLVAGGKGYFVAETPEEVQEWLDTMKQRRNAISYSIAAGEKSLRRMTGVKQPNQHKQRKAVPGAAQTFIL